MTQFKPFQASVEPSKCSKIFCGRSAPQLRCWEDSEYPSLQIHPSFLEAHSLLMLVVLNRQSKNLFQQPQAIRDSENDKYEMTVISDKISFIKISLIAVINDK